MLVTYQQLTRLLLADAGFARFNDFDLAGYINQARLQVAAQGRCVRVYATLPMVIGQRIYPFSAVASLITGVSGIYHVRQAWWQLPGGGPGQTLMYSRPFEWFALYQLNNLNPPQGQPTRWAQFGQGEEGSIFVDPIPDLPYTLVTDVLGTPTPLLNDTTPEAIPDIWTLAVPFYAAWWALQAAQQADAADKMMQRYQEQMTMARAAATPDLTPESWSGAPDPQGPNRIGVSPSPRPQ